MLNSRYANVVFVRLGTLFHSPFLRSLLI